MNANDPFVDYGDSSVCEDTCMCTDSLYDTTMGETVSMITHDDRGFKLWEPDFCCLAGIPCGAVQCPIFAMLLEYYQGAAVRVYDLAQQLRDHNTRDQARMFCTILELAADYPDEWRLIVEREISLLL